MLRLAAGVFRTHLEAIDEALAVFLARQGSSKEEIRTAFVRQKLPAEFLEVVDEFNLRYGFN